MNIEKINNTIELGELIGSLLPLETYSEFDDWVDKNLRHFWSLIEGDVVDFYYLLHSHDASASHFYSIPTGTMHIGLSRKKQSEHGAVFPRNRMDSHRQVPFAVGVLQPDLKRA